MNVTTDCNSTLQFLHRNNTCVRLCTILIENVLFLAYPGLILKFVHLIGPKGQHSILYLLFVTLPGNLLTIFPWHLTQIFLSLYNVQFYEFLSVHRDDLDCKTISQQQLYRIK